MEQPAKETRKRSEDEAYSESLQPIFGWYLAWLWGV